MRYKESFWIMSSFLSDQEWLSSSITILSCSFMVRMTGGRIPLKSILSLSVQVKARPLLNTGSFRMSLPLLLVISACNLLFPSTTFLLEMVCFLACNVLFSLTNLEVKLREDLRRNILQLSAFFEVLVPLF